MKIYIGADHGGFSLKEYLKSALKKAGHEVIDVGAESLDPNDDYPQYAFKLSSLVLQSKTLGILCCRSGGGMAIAANRMKGIRAVDCKDNECVIHARNDNDANVLTLPGDWVSNEVAEKLSLLFINTPTSSEERHRRRVELLDTYQQEKNV